VFTLKKFFSLFRYFLVAPFILYIFNAMAIGIDMYIPINIVTVVVIGIFEIPGFVMLVLFSLFIF